MALDANSSEVTTIDMQDVSVSMSLQELEQLKQESQWLNHLLTVLPAGVVVLDARGVVKQANRVAQSLLGSKLKGELWREVIVSSFKPRKDDGHEVSLVNGKRVKLSITPLGHQPGQLILITDLTETRMLQARTSHMQRLSSLGKMVASVAHQIRTPLSAATLYAANLKNPTLSQSARDTFVDKLLARIKDLESQVSDMLLFAKSEQQIVTNFSLVDLLSSVEKASEAQIQTYRAKLLFKIDDPELSIVGNLSALSGALQNLISNSLQVKPVDAQINVNVMKLNDKQVKIAITDNGPGIQVSQLGKIFEPFYTTKSQGTGLGLAVVKTVVHSHKGSIEVKNVPNGGAEFKIILPLQEPVSPTIVSNHTLVSSQSLRSQSA